MADNLGVFEKMGIYAGESSRSSTDQLEKFVGLGVRGTAVEALKKGRDVVVKVANGAAHVLETMTGVPHIR
jgi:hypothetical protein